MRTNAFDCPRCGQVTRHIEISAREYAALNDWDMGDKIWATVMLDGLGVQKIMNLIHGGGIWKCTKCGLGTHRVASGEIYGSY